MYYRMYALVLFPIELILCWQLKYIEIIFYTFQYIETMAKNITKWNIFHYVFGTTKKKYT